MKTIQANKKALFWAVTALSMSLVVGCDNGGNKSSAIKTPQQETKFKNDTVISGKVTINSDAVSSGEVKALDKNGAEVARAVLDGSNQYILNIPAMTKMPVTLNYHPGDQEASNEQLIAVIVYSAISKYDINERTTAIVKAAKKMGGYSPKNLTIAAENAVNVPDANKTSTGFRGDPTKQYGGWH